MGERSSWILSLGNLRGNAFADHPSFAGLLWCKHGRTPTNHSVRFGRRFEGNHLYSINAHDFDPAMHLYGERFLTAVDDFEWTIVEGVQGLLNAVAADENLGVGLEVIEVNQ